MFGFGSKLFEKFLSFLDGFVDFLFELQAFDGDGLKEVSLVGVSQDKDIDIIESQSKELMFGIKDNINIDKSQIINFIERVFQEFFKTKQRYPVASHIVVSEINFSIFDSFGNK